MPKFRVIRRIGPDIESTSEALLELTKQQAQVFEGLYAQDRVLVEGVAGSGKTFLALHRALAFARAHKRTLFVCFNSALARWLRRQVEEDTQTDEFRHNLSIINFHALAKDLAAKANLAFHPTHGGRPDSHFWDDEAPELLEQAVWIHESSQTDVRFDAIVVDEAQDFAWSWWYALTQSLLRTEDGPLYAFMDPNQSLRGETQRPPIGFETTFRLTVNCRNTRRIAAASASVLKLDSQSLARTPTGHNLVLCQASSPDEQKRLVFQEFRRLLQREGIRPHQIALIAPSSKLKSSISDVEQVDGIPLTTDTDRWHDGQGVLVTTSRSFKGLEADIVLLYDLDRFGDLFQKKDLYVACTRARSLLIAIAHGAECRNVLNTALQASESAS